MHLLFLPLLVPTIVVPALMPAATARIVYLDEHGNPIEPAGVAGGRPAAVAPGSPETDGPDPGPEIVAAR